MRLEGEGTGLEAPFASCTSKLKLREEEVTSHSPFFSSHSLGRMPRELEKMRLKVRTERLEVPSTRVRGLPGSRSGGD
jgi:hypothetical protein